jgi:hypothetical protein
MKSKIDKHNERANRQIFNVKELVSKFNIYGYKNVILYMIMTKTTIESKKLRL